MEFFSALSQHVFLQYALIVSLLASIPCGVVGSFIVARRITYIAGGIAHCILGGIGLARYLEKALGWSFVSPIMGAIVAALLAALAIGFTSLYAKEREDTIIGALWALGMAVGIIAISRTPGYDEQLVSYLFGNIQMLSSRELLYIVVLDAVVLGASALLYRQFLAISFDEEFARLRGLPVEFYYITLLCLTAFSVVLLVSVVGVVMVIALLTLPAAIAGKFATKLWQMMVAAVVICMLGTSGGLIISYSPGLPPGATIIIFVAGLYLIATIFQKPLRRLLRGR